MQAPYIPSPDGEFATWLQNLATLIAGAPTDYGLIVADATIISGVNTAYQSAYTAATDPPTRTSVTIAAKDGAKVTAIGTVRPYCQQIRLNDGVSDALKIGLGINLSNPTRPPIPAPTTAPVLVHVASNPLVATFRYYDVTTPTVKAKPFGAIALELRMTLGTAPAVSPDLATFIANMTKSPNTVLFQPADVGKTCTLWGRWVTKSGPAGVAQSGPWSTALSFTVL